MESTRREVCQAGVLGALTAILGGCNTGGGPAPTGAPESNPSASAAPASFSVSDFSSHVGSRFRFADAGGKAADLTLVRTFDTTRPVDATESFVLTFESKAARALEQDTYAVSHAALGSFSLFIVPAEATPSGQRYTAVFNLV